MRADYPTVMRRCREWARGQGDAALDQDLREIENWLELMEGVEDQLAGQSRYMAQQDAKIGDLERKCAALRTDLAAAEAERDDADQKLRVLSLPAGDPKQ